MPASQGRMVCKSALISASNILFSTRCCFSHIIVTTSSCSSSSHGHGYGSGGSTLPPLFFISRPRPRPRLFSSFIIIPHGHATISSSRTIMTTGGDNNEQVTTTGPGPGRAHSSSDPPPNPIPNRPLRGSGSGGHNHLSRNHHHPSSSSSSSRKGHCQEINRGRPHPNFSNDRSNPNNVDKIMNQQQPLPLQSSVLHFLNHSLTTDHDDTMDPAPSSSFDGHFPDKFKLGVDNKDDPPLSTAATNPQLPIKDGRNDTIKSMPGPLQPQPQDADEIFKKMKETGLIPNAVAMLDGLCKDGLVQEAMKLFGLMREKGTIPDVVIYTAVVQGFCQANKPDDAKRIFNKMLSNGISPNAFTYSILIQGLCQCNKLEDAIDISAEMLQAGHSPNVATFVVLVDGLTREKGMLEARAAIENLKQRGFFLDEKAVREYLDKKAPSMPLVWEALFGKKGSQSQRLF